MSGGDRGRKGATSTYLYGFNGMAFGMDFNILWVGSTISAQDLCRLYYNVQQEIVACCYTYTNSDHNQTFSCVSVRVSMRLSVTVYEEGT